MARHRTPRAPLTFTRALTLALLAPWLSACPSGDDDDGAPVPILSPEPAGAPDEAADGLDEDGRTTLGCLGHNVPAPPEVGHLTLPGWIRSFADPANVRETPPDGAAVAYDEAGVWIASAASDSVSGRVAVGVPIGEAGFIGRVVVKAPGFVDQSFVSSRPITNVARAGWSWLVSPTEVDDLATAAAVELDPAQGIVVGAVHDCRGFGVANAVIRVGDRTDGVVFFAEDAGPPVSFPLAPDRTFTTVTGRFAVPNVAPGVVTVEAFGRREPGGPLELLSRADVEVFPAIITAVALEPRMGVER